MPYKRKTVAERGAPATGNKSLLDIFKRKRARGRPAGRRNTRANPVEHALALVPARSAPTPQPNGADASAPICRRPIMDWSLKKNNDMLLAAMQEWVGKTGRAHDNPSVREFSLRVSIARATFMRYANAQDPIAAVKDTSGVGRPQLLRRAEGSFIVTVLRRLDRANKGKDQKEAVDVGVQLRPDLNKTQIRDSFRRTIRPANRDVLTGRVRMQMTTTERTACTVKEELSHVHGPRAGLPARAEHWRHPAW